MKHEGRNGKFCVCILLLLVILGVFLIFFARTYLATPKKPSCSIDQFHISAPNSTLNDNQTISFDLKLVNKDRPNGVYYDPLNLTISYRPTTTPSMTMLAIATYTIPGFYQGYHKTTERSGLVMVETLDGVVWNNGTTTAAFRVKLDTRVRFKSVWGMKKSKRLLVAANFEVDPATGNKVNNKGVKLKKTGAAAAGPCLRHSLMVVVVLSTAMILFVL